MKKLKLIRNLGIAALFAYVVGDPVANHFSLEHDIDQNRISGLAEANKYKSANTGVFILTGGAGRIDHGIELAKEIGCRAFISGCDEKSRYVMERFAKNCGAEVTLGFNAHDTLGNAFEIRDWIKKNPQIRNVIIVTSDYHAARSLQALRRELTDTYNIDLLLVENKARVREANFCIYGKEMLKNALLNTPFVGEMIHGNARDSYTSRHQAGPANAPAARP
jgi:uncharacterized SAM-binding protein YcdF (DUF218 family)